MNRLKPASLDAIWFNMNTPVTLPMPGTPVEKETIIRCESQNVCKRNYVNNFHSGIFLVEYFFSIRKITFAFTISEITFVRLLIVIFPTHKLCGHICIYFLCFQGILFFVHVNACSLIHCTFGNGLVLVMDQSREWVHWKLNGVVSFITVFEELSHIISFF